MTDELRDRAEIHELHARTAALRAISLLEAAPAVNAADVETAVGALRLALRHAERAAEFRRLDADRDQS